MAENRRGKGQGPYYFTRGQLVLLAAGFTASSIVIFLLGIFIGKGIEERKLLKKEEPLVKMPIQATTGSKSGTPLKEDLTFYDTLAKTRTATQVAEEGQAAEKDTKFEVKETGSVSVKDGKEKAEKTQSAPEVKKQTPAPKTQETAAPENTKRNGGWTVQVNAYGNEKDAQALAKKLKDKGYDSYVTFTTIKGRAWYRVRVGRLETREQAQALQETLKQKEDLSNSITMSR
jgi:cell division septation protein DedD